MRSIQSICLMRLVVGGNCRITVAKGGRVEGLSLTKLDYLAHSAKRCIYVSKSESILWVYMYVHAREDNFKTDVVQRVGMRTGRTGRVNLCGPDQDIDHPYILTCHAHLSVSFESPVHSVYRVAVACRRASVDS